eukprot:15480604-Alexandrium_andersonii.AAC.1
MPRACVHCCPRTSPPYSNILAVMSAWRVGACHWRALVILTRGRDGACARAVVPMCRPFFCA